MVTIKHHFVGSEIPNKSLKEKKRLAFFVDVRKGKEA
jgi:hypothetical protein